MSNAIIIDKDRTMKNAILITIPNSQHKFCLQHIMRKMLDKLGKYGVYKTSMKSQFMKCVYECQNIDTFE